MDALSVNEIHKQTEEGGKVKFRLAVEKEIFKSALELHQTKKYHVSAMALAGLYERVFFTRLIRP
jgi:hypothetical protein